MVGIFLILLALTILLCIAFHYSDNSGTHEIRLDSASRRMKKNRNVSKNDGLGN
jgi:hypothetical protein